MVRLINNRSASKKQSSRPKLQMESLEPRLVLDSTVVFNEIMYNPPGTDETLEAIEIFNQLAVDVDLSEWEVSGIGYEFPEGTTIPGSGYLVIAKDPTALEAATGFTDALGPYLGSLDNNGENLELLNNSGRIMDAVDFSDGGDWPVGPDGSGATLAKFDETTASEFPENWRTSFQVGGTIGTKNFPGDTEPPVSTTVVDLLDTWSYEDTDTDLSAQNWTDPGFDDSLWPTGPALFFAGDGSSQQPPSSPLGLSFSPITNDLDSGISSSKSYTHTLDFGTGDDGATVNGVSFTKATVGTIDGISGFSYTANTGTRNDFGFHGNHNVSGDVVDLFGDFIFNGGNDPLGVATITLSNLTIGNTYETRIYTRQFGFQDGPFPGGRAAQFDFDTDGIAGAEDTVNLNQDDATDPIPGLDVANRAYAVTYKFVADSTTLTIDLTQQNANNSWHLYGLTNEVVSGTSLTYVPIDNDANSGISSDKFYTHKLDFGTGPGATINGVTFEPVSTANVDSITDFSYTVDSGTRNNFGVQAGYAGVSGDVFDLYSDFMFNGNNAAGGVATLTLSNLVVGRDYETRIYTRPFGVGGGRISDIDFDTDGVVGAETSVTIGQDDSSNPPVSFAAADQDYAIVYRFTADSTQLTVDFTQQALNESWHVYGLTNQLLGEVAPAKTAITTVFGTGLDDDGLPLAAGAPDTHFTIELAPNNNPIPGTPATTQLAHPAWLANDAASQWISTVANGVTNIDAGDFIFQTTFDLTGWDASTAEVLIQVAVDNTLTDVIFNGVNTGFTVAGFGALAGSLLLDEDFLSGVNTVQFLVNNAGAGVNPGGFRAEITGLAVPELKNTEVALGPTTHYFRTDFDFNDDISKTTLFLSHFVDDGAVFYLNGTEILRENIAAGVVDHNTLAESEIFGDATQSELIELPTAALVNGTNTLAVELHQATVANADVLFGAELIATVTPPAPDSLPKIAFNEVAAATDALFQLELINLDDQPIDLENFVIATTAGLGNQFALPAGILNPGELLSLDETELGFDGVDNERLFLYTPGLGSVIDARSMTNRLRGRSDQHDGRWLYPDSPTFGSPNSFSFNVDVVINEIMFHHTVTPASPAVVQETEIIGLEATWSFDQTDVFPGASWPDAGFDDSLWPTGDAIFFAGPFSGSANPTPQTITTLFSTGFDAAGVALINDGTIDGHYTLISAPGGVGPDTLKVLDTGFPIPPWVANDVNSQWISHTNLAGSNGTPGTYTYQTTFDLDGFNTQSAEILLSATADDSLVDVLLNGNSMGISHSGFGAMSGFFTIDTGFVNGINTLQFVVSNGGTTDNPTGLKVHTFGTAEPLPANTELNVGPNTYYFRNEFNFAGDPTKTELEIISFIDDGAVLYLNGVEIHRQNLSADPVQHTSAADASVVDEATFTQRISIPAGSLVAGNNVLAVEVHQAVDVEGDMAFAVQLFATETLVDAVEFDESPEEWIELYNRSNAAIDLTGWKFDDGVNFDFALGTTIAANDYLVIAKDSVELAATYPAIAAKIVGNYSGKLSNGGELLSLRDANKNPVDEVRYYDGKPWPEFSDGGGSSLELRDPDADNSKGEAWAASDESSKTSWQTYTIRGVSNPTSGSNDPVLWDEFIFGMLDAGEILIDDISVIEDPDGTAIQFIQNGSFNGGLTSYRAQGNHGTHGLTEVIEDPENPGSGDMVLHLVATGAAEHMFNHVETTFAGGEQLVDGRVYEISFRAKWLGGSNQLNTRLYFNRLATTTLLDRPTLNGTPGAINSQAEVNIGPTYSGLKHGPVVPQAAEDVTVSVVAEDPDGILSMTLFYSVEGGAFASTAMTLTDGRYSGVIPGQVAGATIQFYVEGTDNLSAISTFPAAGADSRALIQVNDGFAVAGPHKNFRIIMTQVDEDLIHQNSESLSNQRMGATIIENEDTIYYDVGLRMKGSGFSRDSVAAGYNIRFGADNLFRGVHNQIAVDRNGGPFGIGASHRELVLKHIANAAGDIPGMYDELINVISPRSSFNGRAQLIMARYDDVFLESSFDNGGDGTRFKFDLIYYSNVIPGGGVESTKNTPNGVLGVELRDIGNDKEAYRNNFLIKNHRAGDDFTQIIELGKTLSLTGSSNGSELDDRSQAVMDVDQWLRLFAYESLGGINDTYNQGLPHNIQFFVRPEDNRVIALPWDMDFAFHHSPNMSVFGTGSNFKKVIDIPNNRHYFLGHVNDIMNTTFNTTYLTPWVEHYSAFGQTDLSTDINNYITDRTTSVQGQLPAAVNYGITTVGPLVVNETTATVDGVGWVNVREIRLVGSVEPLEIVWSNDTTWHATVPVAFGNNTYTLEAYDFQGNLIGTETIDIESTVSARPIQDFLRITELHYHPAGNGDLEFIELKNISDTFTLDLTGVQIIDGPSTPYTFTFGRMLAPEEYILVVRDQTAFEAFYTAVDSNLIDGEYTGGLSNGGERIHLVDADGATVLDFTYEDGKDLGEEDWHPETDGDGFSLVILDENGPTTNWEVGTGWRSSAKIPGSPGEDDLTPLSGDFNGDGTVNQADLQLLLQNYGLSTGSYRFLGDANNDGKTGLSDLLVVKQNFGSSLPSAPPAAAAAAALTVSVETSITNLIPNAVVKTAPIRRSSSVDQVLSIIGTPTQPQEDSTNRISARRTTRLQQTRNNIAVDHVHQLDSSSISRVRASSLHRARRGHRIHQFHLTTDEATDSP